MMLIIPFEKINDRIRIYFYNQIEKNFDNLFVFIKERILTKTLTYIL
jgi:hypothetical protein